MNENRFERKRPMAEVLACVETVVDTLNLFPYESTHGELQRFRLIHNIENEVLLQKSYRMAKTTALKCDFACALLKFLLNRKYPGRFVCRNYLASENLTYFKQHQQQHEVLAVEDQENGLIGIFSPANAYNPDFSIPRFRDEAFWRTSRGIVARSQVEAFELLYELEGGTDWHQVERPELTAYELELLLKAINSPQKVADLLEV